MFGWASLALSYSFPLPVRMVGENAGAVSFAIGAASVFCLRHRPFALTLVLLACSVPGFIGWLLLVPRDDRRWQSDMAETPWAEISADHVTLHNFRNTVRRTADSYSPRWETRRFSLSALRGLDYYIVYWESPHIGHTMMTFDFGPEGRVCASIEARREQGEIYAPLAGAFRQYELLYVLGDERDIVRARTPLNATDHVHLFRLDVAPETIRAVFLDYLRACNALRARPAWYHSLAENCSTGMRRHMAAAGIDAPWDWRVVANGYFHERLYEQGLLDRTLPLEELKARSLINPAAQAAGDTPDFSERIRQNLPIPGAAEKGRSEF
jgi:hypothetical protein